MKNFLYLFLLAGFGLSIQAQVFNPSDGTVFFKDDFESGNMSRWTATDGDSPQPLTIFSPTKNIEPPNGNFSALMNSSQDRMHHNLGKEIGGRAVVSFWLWDPGDNASDPVNGTNRITTFSAGVMAYTGKGLPNGGTTPDGTLQHSIAVGRSQGGPVIAGNGEAMQANRYHGRVSFPGFDGWFNLNLQAGTNTGACPFRSSGWHRFDIERSEDGTLLKFYIDHVLSKSIGVPMMAPWDTIYLGTGSSAAQTGNIWFDGVAVTEFPDMGAPTVKNAYGSHDFDSFTLCFSEPLTASMMEKANYALSDGLTILAVERLNENAVRLVTSPQQPGKKYSVTINNVRDLRDKPIAANTKVEVTTPVYSFFNTSFTNSKVGTVVGSAVIEGGFLKVTPAEGGKLGSFQTPKFNEIIQGFTASFKLNVSGGTGADGIGFNLLTAPLVNPYAAGGANQSLDFNFDTYKNNTEDLQSVRLRVRAANGTHTLVTNRPVGFVRKGGAGVEVVVHVDPDGTVDLSCDGIPVFSNVPAYTNKVAGYFGFGANTGGAWDNHWINDLRVSVIPATSETVPPTLLEGSAKASKIFLKFSEGLREPSALNKNNFVIEPAVAIDHIELNDEKNEVILILQESMLADTTYQVTVKDVQDRAFVANTLSPNPSTISVQPVFFHPPEIGQTVTGFQDDFRGKVRDPHWIPFGPAEDVYEHDPATGVLVVGGAAGLPNHLLYVADGYEGTEQEILMRVRYDEVSGGGPLLGGAVVVAGGIGFASENKGINGMVRSGHDTVLYEDETGIASGPAFVNWQTSQWYWLRLKADGTTVYLKQWPADGNEAEPASWGATVPQAGYLGYAGITAPYENPTQQFMVDYILIKAAGLPETEVKPEAVYGPPDVVNQPILTIQKTANGVEIRWEGEHELLWSDNVKGSFEPVPNAPVSPFEIEALDPMKFFQLRLK